MWLSIFFLGLKSSAIETMLSLVNKYGLSHVCADREFKNIEYVGDGKGSGFTPINFPYLDIKLKPDFVDGSLAKLNIDFFLRGTKDNSWKFQNLFEYLFWTNLHGAGKIYFNTFFKYKF